MKVSAVESKDEKSGASQSWQRYGGRFGGRTLFSEVIVEGGEGEGRVQNWLREDWRGIGGWLRGFCGGGGDRV